MNVIFTSILHLKKNNIHSVLINYDLICDHLKSKRKKNSTRKYILIQLLAFIKILLSLFESIFVLNSVKIKLLM